jgi:hypothetical protein
VRIGGVFKNSDDATNIGQAIQSELLGNRQLVQDFGPFAPEASNKDKSFAYARFSVVQRTRRSKEPTVALFGAQSRGVLGHRTDWSFCDDIVHDQNAGNPERRYKLKEWFMQGPATMGEKADSRLTVVGTRFDPEDLYGDLLEMVDPETGRPLYAVLDAFRDAIVDDEKKLTLWPEQWPYVRLMQRKSEMGTLDFNKRYRNIAVDRSRMVFKEEFVTGGYVGRDRFTGCLDKKFKIGDDVENMKIYAGFDPAIGVTKSAKFCAHVILGVGSCKDHERCYWVVDLHREQLTMPQQIDAIIERHIRHSADMSVIEANAYQRGLFESVNQRLAQQGITLRVEPHLTTRINKVDSEVGVAAMAPFVERGQFHIPWGDSYSQRRMRFLVDELIQYPGRTTDTVMALWFAWKAAQQEAPRYKAINRLAQRGSMWGRASSRRVVRNPAYAG